MLVKIALPLILALPAVAQIHVHCSPESLGSNVLGIKNVGTWDCSLTNYNSQAAVVSMGMIMTAMPRLHPINPKRAQELIKMSFNNSKRSRMIRALNFISPLAIALVGGGIISMSAQVAVKAVTATSLFNTAAQTYRSYLEAQQPDPNVYSSDIPNEIHLAPFGQSGFSPTFTLISGLIKGADSMDGDVYYPVGNLQPAPKPTASLEPPLINFSGSLWGF